MSKIVQLFDTFTKREQAANMNRTRNRPRYWAKRRLMPDSVGGFPRRNRPEFGTIVPKSGMGYIRKSSLKGYTYVAIAYTGNH